MLNWRRSVSHINLYMTTKMLTTITLVMMTSTTKVMISTLTVSRITKVYGGRRDTWSLDYLKLLFTSLVIFIYKITDSLHKIIDFTKFVNLLQTATYLLLVVVLHHRRAMVSKYQRSVYAPLSSMRSAEVTIITAWNHTKWSWESNRRPAIKAYSEAIFNHQNVQDWIAYDLLSIEP